MKYIQQIPGPVDSVLSNLVFVVTIFSYKVTNVFQGKLKVSYVLISAS